MLEPIGSGAFSTVAKGRHAETGQLVALKLSGPDPEQRARLQHEARILARLGRARRRGVVELLATGIEGDLPWSALTFIAGPDLATMYAARRYERLDGDWAEVARIGSAIADSLAQIHDRGVVHGDLSPRNILLEGGLHPVLIDFDSARVAFDGSAMRDVIQTPISSQGTPGYSAPEQILATNADARSDLYALGCILYELIASGPPFRADTTEALCQQHLRLQPLPLSVKLPGIPRELDDLILTLLAKDPKARLNRAEEVVERLSRFSHPLLPLVRLAPRKYHLHRPQLIGRESAIKSMENALLDTALNRGRLLLVSGQSGVGKTRLLNELAQRAQKYRVVFGRCSALGAHRGSENSSPAQALEPFLPFLDWLASDRQIQKLVPDELAPALTVLSQYAPALQSVRPMSDVPPLPPELGRARVLQSLLDLLVAASAKRPLLLLIDDLQWADDLTRAFLREDYRALLMTSKVLIVAAHRSEERDAISLGEGVQRLQLHPLQSDELGAFAMDMLGTELVPAGLTEALHRYSQGNPFYAAEYLRAFIECGLLVRSANNDWQFSELQVNRSSLKMPSSLQDLFALRVNGLTAAAKEVLELSSLLERQFDGSLVEALARNRRRGLATEHALQELVTQRILDHGGRNQYRFVHDKLREAQAQAIPLERRRELHRAIARLLDVGAAPCRFQISSSELGLHWAEAGEPTQAVPHLKLAAQQAAAQHMNAEAVELYALALSQVDIAIELGKPAVLNSLKIEAVELGEARADVLGWSARHQESCAQLDTTLALVRGGDSLRKARLERKKAKTCWTLHDYQNAAAALERAELLLGALHELTNLEQFQEWIEIQQSLFWLQYFSRRAGADTNRLMQIMAGVVETHGTPIQKSMFYECAACELLARERYLYSERAVEFARRANLEVCSKGEHVAQHAEARFSLAFVLLQGPIPQCREAAHILEENLKVLEPIGEATLLTLSLVYLAVAWRRCGDVPRTLAVAERARKSAERVRVVPYVGAAIACEAWTLWKSGHSATAQNLAEQACTWWTKGPHTFPFQWLAKFMLLDNCYMVEDFATASRILAELADVQQQRFPKELEAILLNCCAISMAEECPRRSSEALRQVLQLARQYSYL